MDTSFNFRVFSTNFNEENFVDEFKKEVRPLLKKDSKKGTKIKLQTNRYSIKKQIYSYFESTFGKYQGFRKGFNTQSIRLVMIEEMKTARENKQAYATTLTHSPKFDSHVRKCFVRAYKYI